MLNMLVVAKTENGLAEMTTTTKQTDITDRKNFKMIMVTYKLDQSESSYHSEKNRVTLLA